MATAFGIQYPFGETESHLNPCVLTYRAALKTEPPSKDEEEPSTVGSVGVLVLWASPVCGTDQCESHRPLVLRPVQRVSHQDGLLPPAVAEDVLA